MIARVLMRSGRFKAEANPGIEMSFNKAQSSERVNLLAERLFAESVPKREQKWQLKFVYGRKFLTSEVAGIYKAVLRSNHLQLSTRSGDFQSLFGSDRR
jgi:hypothetical protein